MDFEIEGKGKFTLLEEDFVKVDEIELKDGRKWEIFEFLPEVSKSN